MKNFAKSTAGNFSLALALGFPALLMACGLALDISNLVTAKSTLQSALDGALLASSRFRDEASSRQAVFHSFFETNAAGSHNIASPIAVLDVTQDVNSIKTEARAEADVPLYFSFLFGKSARVEVQASAYESTSKLEVALVLDNTGSMGEARMASLRGAATALVDILRTVQTPDRDVKAALVPFVTAVNVKGEGFSNDWIDNLAKAPYHGANFDPGPDGQPVNHKTLFANLGVEWKGCVEARPVPYNLTDAAPDEANPATLFVPYFAPDEPGNATKAANASDKINNTYLDDMVGGTDIERQKSTVKYSTSTPSKIEPKAPLTSGPNYACATPITPLTSDFDKLSLAISKMTYWNGSGTNVGEGLAWGMRVLSPGEPYTQGVPFKSLGTSKAAVVFTDGENVVFGASAAAINKSDYGPYGYLDSGRYGSTERAKALTQVNAWTLSMCESLKNQEVQVFTVLLGADTPANRKLYSECASTPDNYFPANDVTELRAVFIRIGAAIAHLHLTN